jgi:hypothetical protein
MQNKKENAIEYESDTDSEQEICPPCELSIGPVELAAEMNVVGESNQVQEGFTAMDELLRTSLNPATTKSYKVGT